MKAKKYPKWLGLIMLLLILCGLFLLFVLGGLFLFILGVIILIVERKNRVKNNSKIIKEA